MKPGAMMPREMRPDRSSFRLLAVGFLALGSGFSCQTAPEPEERSAFACSEEPSEPELHYDNIGRVVRRKLDTNQDGVADDVCHYEKSRPVYRALDRDFDGEFDFWTRFDDAGNAQTWKYVSLVGDVTTDPHAQDLLETTDRAVAEHQLSSRVVPARESHARCLARPEVEVYLTDAKKLVYEQWIVPGMEITDEQVLIRFSIDRFGTLRSACLASSAGSELGRSALRAVQRTAPLPKLPDGARCLEGRRMTGTFRMLDAPPPPSASLIRP